MPQKRKPCDGTANDYRRHRKNGETACVASKVAWALAQRQYQRSRIIIYPAHQRIMPALKGAGLFRGDLPGTAGDEFIDVRESPPELTANHEARKNRASLAHPSE